MAFLYGWILRRFGDFARVGAGKQSLCPLHEDHSRLHMVEPNFRAVHTLRAAVTEYQCVPLHARCLDSVLGLSSETHLTSKATFSINYNSWLVANLSKNCSLRRAERVHIHSLPRSPIRTSSINTEEGRDLIDIIHRDLDTKLS